jgi:hypothetical protein
MADFKENNKNSLLSYFFSLLIRPSRTIKKILIDQPSFQRLAVFIFIISIFRGMIESVWMLLREGQFAAVVTSPVLFKSYLILGIPFMVSSITAGYVRWFGFALVPCLLARFWGREAHYRDFLRVTGVMMGLYVVTILPNFAYLFFDLPVIQFSISKSYNPALGVGQMITGTWLVLIIYKMARLIAGLTAWQSFLAGLTVLLGNLGALLSGAMFFFNLPYVNARSFRGTLNMATFLFNIATVLLIPFFLWLGTRTADGRWLKVQGGEQ